MHNSTFVLLLVFAFFFTVLIGCGEKKVEVKQDKQKTEEKKDNTTQQQPPATEQKKEEVKTDAKDDNKGPDFVKFETTLGNFTIKLFSDKAPLTTGNFKGLVKKGFYNGVIFHRVIDGFMIQGGDPTGTGRGGSGVTINDEFGPGLKHDKKGILSMANAGPNTGQSQFFITLAPTPHLDGRHAIFGEVVDGMSVVEKIGKVKTGPGDKPVEDVKMTKVYLSDSK